MGVRRYERIVLGAVLAVAARLPSAPAAPTFQAYIEGAAARNVGGDQDTWGTTHNTFDLVLAGAGNDNYAGRSLVLGLNDQPAYQNDLAESLYCDVRDFGSIETIRDYGARTGILVEEDRGREKVFTLPVAGLSWAHFDLGGSVDRESGDDAWEIDPGSHDTVYVDEPTLEFMPSPASLLVAALGVILIGWVRLRKAL